MLKDTFDVPTAPRHDDDNESDAFDAFYFSLLASLFSRIFGTQNDDQSRPSHYAAKQTVNNRWMFLSKIIF